MPVFNELNLKKIQPKVATLAGMVHLTKSYRLIGGTKVTDQSWPTPGGGGEEPPPPPPSDRWKDSTEEETVKKARLSNTGTTRYYNTSDVQANSPNDGSRIKSNAATFLTQSLANPDYALWTGIPPTTEPFRSSTGAIFDIPATRIGQMRDACYLYHMYGEEYAQHAELAAAVLAKLTDAAVRPRLIPVRAAGWPLDGVVRVSDSGLWTNTNDNANEGFQMAAFHEVCFECFYYLGRGYFTSSLLSQHDYYFRTWMHFLKSLIYTSFIAKLNNLLTAEDVNELSHNGPANASEYTHRWNNGDLGYHTRQVNRYFNNRLLNTVGVFHQMACYYGDAMGRQLGQILFKAYFAFGWYAGRAGYVNDGINNEYLRSTTGEPARGGKGAYYVAETMYRMNQIAMHEWRVGNPNLVTYTTKYGIYGSSGGDETSAAIIEGPVDKGLLWGWLQFSRLQQRKLDNSDWDLKIWCRNDTVRTDIRNRITLMNGTSGAYHSLADITASMLSRMIDDSRLRNIYTRTGPGYFPGTNAGYPSSYGTNGGYSMWQGPRVTSPGILLENAYMESVPLLSAGWTPPA